MEILKPCRKHRRGGFSLFVSNFLGCNGGLAFPEDSPSSSGIWSLPCIPALGTSGCLCLALLEGINIPSSSPSSKFCSTNAVWYSLDLFSCCLFSFYAMGPEEGPFPDERLPPARNLVCSCSCRIIVQVSSHAASTKAIGFALFKVECPISVKFTDEMQ